MWQETDRQRDRQMAITTIDFASATPHTKYNKAKINKQKNYATGENSIIIFNTTHITTNSYNQNESVFNSTTVMQVCVRHTAAV